jgi:hypothetical protein
MMSSFRNNSTPNKPTGPSNHGRLSNVILSSILLIYILPLILISNQMNMRDANTGKLLWTSRRWTPQDMFDDIMEGDHQPFSSLILTSFNLFLKTAQIPKSILECDAVSREINFSSREQIQSFRLEQRIFVHGTCLEGQLL